MAPKHRLLALQRHLNSHQSSCSSVTYTTRSIGAANTLEHRIYIEQNGTPVSAFHDIPIFHAAVSQANTPAAPVYNMIVEIPRWSNAKLEISKSEPLNPILQDTKKGTLRFVRNCFPHHGYIHNYGAFPQTWEDPSHISADTGLGGDNDPLDVCEIGDAVGYAGQVKQVKVLGVLALLDEGETDWKVIAIDVFDPLAPLINCVADVELHKPGLLQATYEWFKNYKIPDGKPENKFAFGGEFKDRDYALRVVTECHEAWFRLTQGAVDAKGISLVSAATTRTDTIPQGDNLPPAPIDKAIDKWFYIK